MNIGNNDIIQTNRDVYYFSYNNDIILFSPTTCSVTGINQHTRQLLDLCNFPTTFSHLTFLFNKITNNAAEEVTEILSRLHRSGFVTINANFHPSIATHHADPSCSKTNPAATAPHAATVHLTDRCNLECAYCFNEETRKKQRSELNVNEWNHLLNDIVASGVKRITASGGEPLLREDILPLFGNMRKKGIGTQIITNSTLLSKENAQLLDTSFDDYNGPGNLYS